MITVTKPFFPPLEEYVRYLEEIWESGQLTNQGPLVRRLEQELATHLGAKHVLFVANGTLAIQLAIRALSVTKEVITTPFSYVATTSSLLWEHCVPVFADIDGDTFCIDPRKVEAAITPRTEAILATHVFGYPCDVAALKAIADRHGLKIIYDGAHAFDAVLDGQSVLNHGDVTTLSFHATKLFHTGEGGALVTDDDRVAKSAGLMRSFGHQGDDHYCVGVNAKSSELNAAMGLCLLPRVQGFIRRRREITELYDSLLAGSRLRTPPKREGHNYAYYPVVLPSEDHLLRVHSALADGSIGTRRYFYPSLNKLPYLQWDSAACPVSEDIARRVLCLPIYVGLADDDVRRTSEIIKRALGASP